jgi:hypothetical protein
VRATGEEIQAEHGEIQDLLILAFASCLICASAVCHSASREAAHLRGCVAWVNQRGRSAFCIVTRLATPFCAGFLLRAIKLIECCDIRWS